MSAWTEPSRPRTPLRFGVLDAAPPASARSVRQQARANPRRLVRRVLRRRGYPLDKQDAAVDRIIVQAEETAAPNA